MLSIPEGAGLAIHHLANAFGYELEDICRSFEKKTTDHNVKVGCGTIKAGKVAAVRARTAEMIDGHEAIAFEHVSRMTHDTALDWPWTDRSGRFASA